MTAPLAGAWPLSAVLGDVGTGLDGAVDAGSGSSSDGGDGGGGGGD